MSYIRLLFFVLSWCFSLFCVQAQGLKFKGNRFSISERTSYAVFQNTQSSFQNKLNVSFDFLAEDILEAGYILRIKTQDPNLTFNLSYDAYSESAEFKLNREGRSSLISLHLNKNKGGRKKWKHISLEFNLVDKTIKFEIEGHSETYKLSDLPSKLTPDIYFGKSDYFIDVPSFSIRDLKVYNDRKEYYFPLKEYKDNLVHNEQGKETGYVANPIWLINDAYHWRLDTSFRFQSVGGYNFDSIRHKIYYFNKDSLIAYDIRNKRETSVVFEAGCPMNPKLGFNFFDERSGKLYFYEVISLQAGSVNIAAYDLQKNTWTPISTDTLDKQRHHHGQFFDEKNNRLIIFGGFGHMQYNNTFDAYDLNKNKWERLSFTGDTIHPRYFLSMGYDKYSNSLYIFGGMGNDSGDYSVGRRYLYDLYRVDLNDMHITKKWEISWEKEYNVVPVKGMIVGKEHFTTLCYPEHLSESYLKLYQFSIEDGSFEILGDSIPIRSDKITTNANLYYSDVTSEMYGVVQEFERDDVASSLKIYSIAMPAVSRETLFGSNRGYLQEERDGIKNMMLIGLAVILCIVIGLFRFRQKRKRRDLITQDEKNSNELTSVSNDINWSTPNTVYVFGNFTVYDRKSKDISYMFSNRLRQTFVLILIRSHEDGISSQELTEILWPDRDESKSKNIRGVTINNLRKVLDELEGVKLVYEKSLYKLIFGDNSHCDYMDLLEAIDKDTLEISMFTKLFKRGKFLKDEPDSIFDNFKSEVENRIEPSLKLLVENTYNELDFQSCIILAGGMLDIDPASDFAISYLVRSMNKLGQTNEAKKRFYLFDAEYKNMMGETYPKQFGDL